MEDNTMENGAAAETAEKIKLTPSQFAKKVLWEFLDMLKGAAFPFIVMCVFSSTIILFYGFDDPVVKVIAIVGGEALMIGAFVMFGRQNGAAALRKTMINEGKRKLSTSDRKVLYGTGEYSPYKGFVIGFITVVPFIILQIIKCTGDYQFVDFMLQYACGWAVAPLDVIGGVPRPVYLAMIIFPIGIHGGFYIQGKFAEVKRQEAIRRAEDDMKKGKKKHYYEENKYERDSKKVVVDIPEERPKVRGKGKK